MDVLQGKYDQQQAIRPRLADFEALVERDREAANAHPATHEVEEAYAR
jgi:hypothetical protein